MQIEVDPDSKIILGPENVNDYVDLDLTHSIHTSERRSFRGCRRRWSWIFRDYWYPRTTAKPLEFGTAYHAAMETLYQPDLWYQDAEVRQQAAREEFVRQCMTQYNKYVEIFEAPTMEAQTDYQERMDLGLGMLDYYCRYLLPEESEFTPVKVEIPFEVPIVNPDNGEQLWCKCKTCWNRFVAHVDKTTGKFLNEDNVEVELYRVSAHLGHGNEVWSTWRGVPVSYGGRIDVLMQGADGRYWVLDWKTAARLSTDELRMEFLLLDDQISSYCWALWQLGLPVAGFLYHEQKKGFPEAPEPLKYARQGRRFSVSKTQNYSADLYEETVRENDPDAYEEGLYDDYIEWLRSGDGTRFHARFRVYRNEVELRETGRAIYLEALDIVDPNLRIYPNAGRFSCSFCAFRQPCLGVNQGEDYEYTLATLYDKRKYHYWVEHVPSTESKGGE